MKNDILKNNKLKRSLFSEITIWQAFSLLELSILIIVFAFGFNKLTELQKDNKPSFQAVQSLSQEFLQSEFQAVFLDNGQVYFGKIDKANNKEIILKEIYYLQTNPNTKTAINKPNQDIKLIKFGHELHAPKDEMLINQEHVLFIENLKDDSKIIKAIKNKSQK